MLELIVDARDDYFVVSVRQKGANFSFYLIQGGEVVERRMRQSSASVLFSISSPGFYKVKAFVENADGEKRSAVTDSVYFPLDRVSENESRSTAFKRLSESGIWNTLRIDTKTVGLVEQVKLLTDMGVDPEKFFESVRNSSAAPTGWFNLDRVKGDPQDIFENGWTFQNYEPISFSGDIEWGVPCSKNRTWAYELHSWRFMDPVLKKQYHDGDEFSLRWILRVVESWYEYASQQTTDNMVWYDMAASLRLARLIRVLVAQARHGCDDNFFFLTGILVEHLAYASKPEIFNDGNNHGFYAAAATMDAAKHVPELAQSFGLEALGEMRMQTMVSKQFAPDGGHLEHSPDYHRMLLGSFESALRDGLISDHTAAETIRNAANVLGWMVQPNGELVQFGDSPATCVVGPKRRSSDPNTEFIVSGGLSGTPSKDHLKVLQDSGYAFIRVPQIGDDHTNPSNDSYLAFHAGFHSRAHKHADDLTFVWYDQGHEILVDSGRFGYLDLLPPNHPDRDRGFFYSSPERQYVESTKAHNAVSIEGEDIERRFRDVPGSGLGKCTRTGGRFVLRGGFDYPLYNHQRMLRFLPGSRLEVIDTISSTTPKSFISWFNVGADFAIDVSGKDLILSSKIHKFQIRVTADGRRSSPNLVEPVFGQRDPMRGWRSRRDGSIEGIWNFGFKWKVEGEERVTIAFEVEK